MEHHGREEENCPLQWLQSQFYLIQHKNDWCPDAHPPAKKRKVNIEMGDEGEEEFSGFEPLLDKARDEAEETYVEKVKQYKKQGLSNKKSEIMAEEEMPSILRKVFRIKYRQLLEIWYRLERNPIHQKVMSTIQRLMEEEEYTWPEAIAAGLRERKYLFDPLFDKEEEEESPSEEEEDEEEEEEEEEGTGDDEDEESVETDETAEDVDSEEASDTP